MYNPNVCTPTMFEDELRALTSMPAFSDPQLQDRITAVVELRKALKAVREIPGWSGESVGNAQGLLDRMEGNANRIEAELTAMRSRLTAAASATSAAAGAALNRLPSASAEGFLADAGRNLSGITDGWGALDTGEMVAQEEARLAAERETAAMNELAKIRSTLAGQAASQFKDGPARDNADTSSVPLPVIDVDGIDSRVPPVGSNGPSATYPSGGPSGSGQGGGQGGGPSDIGRGGFVPAPYDPTFPTNPTYPDPTYPDPTGPGNGGNDDPSVDSPGVGVLPSLPGTVPGGIGGGPGGGGLLPGGGGPGSGLIGAGGAGAAGAAALLGTRSAALGGISGGGSGMFKPGGSLGSGIGGAAAGGRGLLGMQGAAGTPGGGMLGGGAAGSASGSGSTSGSAAGGRSMGPGMMGGGAAGDEEKRAQRSGLGGPIAPKLEDDAETGPRSRSAQAGSRDDHA